MQTKGNFEINVKLADESNTEKIMVEHNDETFSFQWKGKLVSILNNGDNSWSIVEGNLDQLTVNLIGTAIENQYRSS